MIPGRRSRRRRVFWAFLCASAPSRVFAGYLLRSVVVFRPLELFLFWKTKKKWKKLLLLTLFLYIPFIFGRFPLKYTLFTFLGEFKLRLILLYLHMSVRLSLRFLPAWFLHPYIASCYFYLFLQLANSPHSIALILYSISSLHHHERGGAYELFWFLLYPFLFSKSFFILHPFRC